MSEEAKDSVAAFWNAASCGEDLLLAGTEAADYTEQMNARYALEPYIRRFIAPERWAGKTVLEIGVGLGADHQVLAENGAILFGIDLTPRAVEHTRRRLALFGKTSDLRVADSEYLPFDDNSFDMVYAWGVIHHTPDTPKAAAEILRVLKPGGEFRVMIYHKWSLVGLMLWARYALLAGRPFTPLAEIYARYLESPGTKAYSVEAGRALFAKGVDVTAEVVLTHADLLESGAGQRHRGAVLDLARRLWPRFLLKRLAGGNGLFLLLRGQKPREASRAAA